MTCTRTIAAIIVQYNNWQDTLACLESVLRSRCLPRWIMVVDNASSNGAVREIERWACQQGLPLCVASPQDAAAHMAACSGAAGPHVLLVCSEANRGYAGGNNVGLRLGLEAGAEAFWILNNDTVVDPGACGALHARLVACQRPGMVGGLVCYLADPDMVQCRAGGYTNPWFFLSTMDGHTLSVAEALQTPPEEVEKRLNFIYGASVMVSRAFVETVGLMDERLFLYCEEQDWAWSAAGRFDLAYAPEARILHKEGGSTGMSRLRRPVRRLCLLARNKLLVTCKHKKTALPLVGGGIAFAFFRLLARRLLGKGTAG